MTWTQGQPNRTNQPPFTEPENQDAATQPPVSRTYTRSNDRRPDYRGRQTPPSRNGARPQDVAATFTQEGLQTFSNIFSSAVEAAIAKSLPDIVERSIERKLESVVQQLKRELTLQISELANTMTVQLEPALRTRMTEMIRELVNPAHGLGDTGMKAETFANREIRANEEAEANTVAEGNMAAKANMVEKSNMVTRPSDVSQPMQATTKQTYEAKVPEESFDDDPPLQVRRRTRSEDEVVMVINALKRLGRPVRTSELPKVVEDVYWGSNPSAKITNLMNRSDGRIERTGRGIYEYQERNA